MLPDLNQMSTDSIINDDTQHINSQILDIEKQRSHFLSFILGVWVFVARYIFGASESFAIPIIPTFVAVAFMKFDFGIRKSKLQKIAKCLFFYTLLRSLVWIFVCVFFTFQSVGVAGRMLVSEWVLVIVITFVECLTVYYTLQVLRLTNQYFVLINRKMSRGVTEDDFQYNC